MLNTPRLVLRRWRDRDIAPIAAINVARAALHFSLVDRGLERIVSIATVGNDASERIMAKLGMHLERETVDLACHRPVRVYEITRASTSHHGSIATGRDQHHSPGSRL
jgi:hypothetical protein